MHLSAQLDVELVAVEQEDELTVLLELQAPARDGEERLPSAELDEEMALLRTLADGAAAGEAAWAAKRSRAEHAAKSRRRGV